MVVLDYPTHSEMFNSTPFSDHELLNELLSAAGINLSVYRTYAVKCVPKHNEKPLPRQIDSCKDYLREEIMSMNPEFIVCMGDTALRAITKLSGIKDKRGKELAVHPTFGLTCAPTIYATYSIAFIRKNPAAKSVVISDLRRVAMGGYAKNVDVQWKWWSGESITGDVLAYDIEAVDKNGNYTDYPTQIAITGDNGTFVSRDVRGLGSLLVGRRTVGHNSWGYDVDVLRKFGIPVIKDWDTMVLAYFIDETQPLGLESLAVKYLKVPGWKEAFSSKLGSDEFAFYNARDTHYTKALFEMFKEQLGSRIGLISNIMLPTRVALDGMSERGVYIDRFAVKEVKKNVEIKIAETEAIISKIVYQTWTEMGNDKPFNPGSSTQVGLYLNELGFVLPHTETGKIATGVGAIQHIKGNAFVDSLNEYRSAKKTLSTYVKPYLKIADEGDGRAHSTYTLVRTLTGRTSAQKPNVQNLDRNLKSFFGAPAGKVLVSTDYSAIEFRVAAWLAQEESIIERFRQDANWDPHRYFSSVFYGIEEKKVTKEQRQVAKSANFSQLYLGNHVTIQEYAKKMGIGLSLETCWSIHQTWHNLFPGFRSFYHRVRDEILSTGMVVCPTGHIRHFGDVRYADKLQFMTWLREGANVKVQNLAAHIAFLAIKRLKELNMPMVLFVHDSISFEFDKDLYDQKTQDIIEEAMIKYPIEALRNEFNVDFTIPLTVETEIKRGK